MFIQFIKSSKTMFHSSKALQLPSSIRIKTDPHHNIHLTLLSDLTEEQIPDQNEIVDYIGKLLELENKGNQQLDGNHQEMTKAVWVHLSFNFSNPMMNELSAKILSICSNQFKFNIHHGLGKDISMYRWMTEKKDLVTPYSMFYISCGAIIIENDHILLVQEKNGNRKGQYGVPGGRADLGQTIDQCAQRELFEETGIVAKYQYILHFRELSNTLFNGTDIYFACVVQVENNSNIKQKDKIQVINKSINLCDRQLSNYKWVPLKEYGEFAQENAVGTQRELGRYITELYEKGFDFKSSKNLKKTAYNNNFITKRDGIPRRFIQHFLG